MEMVDQQRCTTSSRRIFNKIKTQSEQKTYPSNKKNFRYLNNHSLDDYDFDKIFSRPFQALVKKNDVLIAISTSGNSKNIIEVLKEAKKKF